MTLSDLRAWHAKEAVQQRETEHRHTLLSTGVANVTYHMRQARQAAKRAEFHEDAARVLV